MSAFPAAAEDGLTMMGIRIPYPMHRRWLPETYRIPGTMANKSYDLRFYISPDGCPDSVVFMDSNKVEIDSTVLGAIQGYDFYPAILDGDSISFIVPARLKVSLRGTSGRIELKLPYNPHLNYRDNELLNETLALNGYRSAAVKWVPSYYCMSYDELSKGIVPFAIFRVSLDAAGLLQNIETIVTNNPSCAKIVSTVLLYSGYRPAEFEDSAIASDFYVTVRNFRQVGNPTSEWPPENIGKAGYLLNYMRIDSKPYLDSVVVYPIPTNLTGDIFHNSDSIKIGDSVKVPVIISPAGHAVISGAASAFSDNRGNQIKGLLSKLQFIPLQDISGQRLAFNGTLTLYFDFSKKIRIRLGWFSDEVQGGPVKSLDNSGLGGNKEGP